MHGAAALTAKKASKGGTLGIETGVERLKTAGFMREVDAAGVKCDDLSLAKFGDLRGVMAKRTLKPGSTFLSYPRSAIMDLASQTSCPCPQLIQEQVRYARARAYVSVAVAVAEPV